MMSPSERWAEIDAAPESDGRKPLAFALALRFDLPVMRVRRLMADAPDLKGSAAISEWVAEIPTRPVLEIVG